MVGGREPNIRQRRVADLIARELSLILQERVQDPRLAGATITYVRMSRDLRQATVFIASKNADNDRETLQALEHSNAFLRRELAARVLLRFVPELQFSIDDTWQRAQRIESLLDQVAGHAQAPGNE